MRMAWTRGKRSLASTRRRGGVAPIPAVRGITTEPGDLGPLPTFAPEFYTDQLVELSGRGRQCEILELRKRALCRSAVECRRCSTAKLHRPIIVGNPGDTPARPTLRSG